MENKILIISILLCIMIFISYGMNMYLLYKINIINMQLKGVKDEIYKKTGNN